MHNIPENIFIANLCIGLLFSAVAILLGDRRENLVRWSFFAFAVLQLVVLFALLLTGFGAEFEILRYGELHLAVLLNGDSFVSGALAVMILGLIATYSGRYLHRERGASRFYSMLAILYLGFQLLGFGGSFSTIFAGWEFMGISSFFLIGFYESRPRAISNAFLVFAIYRLCDLGLFIGSWLVHLYGHGFDRVAEIAQLGPHWVDAVDWAPFPYWIGLAIFFAAAGKSAQFPFSFWLPRAMEGPTPSSAIFYGALSVHAGVLLLLKTEALWFHSLALRGFLFCMGLASVFSGGLSARTQATIKGKLAYASVAQVGFMVMELSLGFGSYVLIHLVGHVFLRSYQLLVSPAIVTIMMRKPIVRSEFPAWMPTRLVSTLRAASVHEFWLPAVARFSARHALGILLPLSLAFGGMLVYQVPGVTSSLLLVSVVTAAIAFWHASAKRTLWLVSFSLALTFLSGVVGHTSTSLDMIAAALSLGIPLSIMLWVLNRSFRDGSPRERSRLEFLLFAGAFVWLVGVPPFPGFFLEEWIVDQFPRSELGIGTAVVVALIFNAISIARIFVSVSYPRVSRVKPL